MDGRVLRRHEATTVETMNGLNEFISDHLGVGNIQSPIWFIGLEPAGAGTREDLQTRVLDFLAQRSSPITNLRRSLIAAGETQYFIGEKPKIQKFWAVVSRLWLQAQGLKYVGTENVRSFQQHILCAPTNDEGPLMLEVSALPSKTSKQWMYKEWSDSPLLQHRRSYLQEVLPKRLQKINDLIEEHRPKVVVCFGNSYVESWKQLKSPAQNGIQILPHPNARPTLTNAKWDALGRELRTYL